MANNFAFYLVEQGVISKDQLIAVLIEQFRTMPSFLQILAEEGGVSTDTLFQLLTLQIATGKGIVSLLEEQQILASDQIERLFAKQARLSKSLLHIIYEKNWVTKENLHLHLQHFHQRPLEPPITVEPVKTVVPTEVKANSIEVNDALMESLKEIGFSDEEIKKQLEEKDEKVVEDWQKASLHFFNDTFFSRVQSQIDDKNLLTFYESILQLKGLALLLECEPFTHFLSQLESTLGHLLKQKEEAINEEMVPLLKECMEHIQIFKDQLPHSFDETKFNEKMLPLVENLHPFTNYN